jgi:tetratricopeptide (TPR) repeat protein
LKKLIFLLSFFLCRYLSAADVKVQSFLDKGDYESAYNLLLGLTDTLSDDEESLYLLGVTAPSGKTSSAFLKEYMQKYPDGEHTYLVRRHLLDYYAAQGLDITAGRIYADMPESTDLGDEDLYRIALSKQKSNEYNKAILFYQAILEKEGSSFNDWAQLGIADCNLLLGENDASISGYKKLVDKAQSSAYPLALLGISEAYRREGKLDKAESFYSRYKAAYPESPGLLEIEAAFSEYHSKDINESIPKTLKGGFFIQVGVFSKKDNAQTCSRKFRNLGYSNRIDGFNESGQPYYRVILGPYNDESSARKIKADLEKSQREEFLIFVQ